MAVQRRKAVSRFAPKKSNKKAIKRISAKTKVVVRKQADIDRLVLEHRENGRKLARSILRGWRVRMPAEETDSIVDLSLCEAAKRYSSKHGASFMTFLFYHLRGNLVRAVATAARLNNFVVAFAKNAGIDITEWANANEKSLWSLIPDMAMFEQRDVDMPEEVLLRRERIETCQNACSQLDALEQEILTRSFANDEPLVDIARSLGYSRCHVSRVKKRALDRVKDLLSETPGPIAIEEKPAGAKVIDITSRMNVYTLKSEKRRARRRRASAPQMIEMEQNDHEEMPKRAAVFG